MSQEGPCLRDYLAQWSELQLESHLHAGGEKLARPIARSLKSQLADGQLKSIRFLHLLVVRIYLVQGRERDMLLCLQISQRQK